MRTLAYMLLLLVAFAIGMVGTVAASRAVVAAAAKPAPAPASVQMPEESPARAPVAPRDDHRPVTTEC